MIFKYIFLASLVIPLLITWFWFFRSLWAFLKVLVKKDRKPGTETELGDLGDAGVMFAASCAAYVIITAIVCGIGFYNFH